MEFEDLECPACAHAYPIVHAAVDKYKIPLMRHDFLIQGHQWSKDAAITARYLEDKVSPEMAAQISWRYLRPADLSCEQGRLVQLHAELVPEA